MGIGTSEQDYSPHDPGDAQNFLEEVPEVVKEVVYEQPPGPCFKDRDLVWVLKPNFSEWIPNDDDMFIGPYRVAWQYDDNSYIIETFDGEDEFN